MRYDLPYGNFSGIWQNPCDNKKQPAPFMPIDPVPRCEEHPPKHPPCYEPQPLCHEPQPVHYEKRPAPRCGEEVPAPCHETEWRQNDECCEKKEPMYYDRSCRKEKDCKEMPGMVYHAPHDGARMYEPMQAFRRGTLYEELDKPMNLCNDQCTRVYCTREQMLAFTIWELRLYLNTHPHDTAALHLFRKLCRECGAMQYACAFLPESDRCWNWIRDPWPWEYAANCDGRGNN